MSNGAMRPLNVGLTDVRIDLDWLKSELASFTSKVPFDPVTQQISLRHRPGATNPSLDGVGSIYDAAQKKFLSMERDYTELNPKAKGTYFEEVIDQVARWCPWPIGRVRLMRLNPKSCLSMHRDADLRLHFPIVTSTQAFFVFEDSPPIHLPANGQMFWANTLKWHSVFNGHSEQARIHLVLSTCASDYRDYLRFIDAEHERVRRVIQQ